MDFQRSADAVSSSDLLLRPDDSAADTSSDMSFSSESSEDIESTSVELHPNRIGQEAVNVVDDFVVEDGDLDWEDELMAGDDDTDGIGMVVDGEEVGVGVDNAEELGVDEDNDDEINMAAYDMVNLERNGLIKTEQAGVIHLVHGWTMRGHPNQVSRSPLIFFFGVLLVTVLVSCTFRAMRHRVVQRSLPPVLTIISRSPLLVLSPWPSRPCSLVGMMLIKRPSRLASGLQMIQAHFWAVPSFINCKAGCIETATMWGHLFLFLWASTLVVK